jgi:hypothetical protein
MLLLCLPLPAGQKFQAFRVCIAGLNDAGVVEGIAASKSSPTSSPMCGDVTPTPANCKRLQEDGLSRSCASPFTGRIFHRRGGLGGIGNLRAQVAR